MRSMTAIAIVISIFCTGSTAAPDSSVPEDYNVTDAYRIYSLLLPREESYRFATDTLMIQEETMTYAGISRVCLTPDAANKFRDAIVNFDRSQRKKWLLQPRFDIQKHYKLVSSGVISALPDTPPSSAALVSMSAVGFNREKSRAIVYIESSCGGFAAAGAPSTGKGSRQVERSTRCNLRNGLVTVKNAMSLIAVDSEVKSRGDAPV